MSNIVPKASETRRVRVMAVIGGVPNIWATYNDGEEAKINAALLSARRMGYSAYTIAA